MEHAGIESQLRAAVEGRRSVLVTGVAGVGKSTLVTRVLQKTLGRFHLRVGLRSLQGDQLGVLAMRGSGGAWPGDVESAAEAMAASLGGGYLVVENLQWVDEASLYVLDRLAGRVPMVVVARAEALPKLDGRLVRRLLEEIVVPRLTVDEATSLAKAQRPRPLPLDIARAVRRSAGVPFVLEQLLAGEHPLVLESFLRGRLLDLGRPALGVLARAERNGGWLVAAQLEAEARAGADLLLGIGTLRSEGARLVLCEPLLGEVALSASSRPGGSGGELHHLGGEARVRADSEYRGAAGRGVKVLAGLEPQSREEEPGWPAPGTGNPSRGGGALLGDTAKSGRACRRSWDGDEQAGVELEVERLEAGFLAGDLERVVDRAARLCLEARAGAVRSRASLALLAGLAQAGRFGEFEATMAALEPDASAAEAPPLVACRAEAEYWQGRPERALAAWRLVADASPAPGRVGGLLAATALWAALELGQEAPDVLSWASSSVTDGEMRGVQELDAGEPARALETFEAAARARSAEATITRARCLWGASRAAEATGELTRAVALLREAASLAERHGFLPLLGRVRRRLRANGLHERTPRRSAGCLTQREHEIVELVGEGRTYVEIGRLLDVSSRTVEAAMISVKQKLGATTRAQAVLLARNSYSAWH